MIQADYRLAAYRVQADGSLRGAINAFGKPTRLRRDSRFPELCYAAWRALGLRITFYNLGGANPCDPRAGRFSQARASGRVWRTSKGLRIRDSLVRLKRLYPTAPRQGRRWWLVTRRSPFGSNALYPGLAAVVARGRVVAFEVSYPAGGD